MTCPWCVDPNAEDVDDPEALCRMHEAEYMGISLHELDRKEAEESAELRDMWS